MVDPRSLPHTPASPGSHVRHETDSTDINDLYRKSLQQECARREFALRLGISTIPVAAVATTVLGFILGLPAVGISILAVIGLSCGPGLALSTLTAHKVFKGRKLKQSVIRKALQMGLSQTKAEFLWKAVCHELDAIDRESMVSGKARSLFLMTQNQRFQEAIEEGEVPWEDAALPRKSLPGL